MSSPTPPEALRRIEECNNYKSPELILVGLGLQEIPQEIAHFEWLRKIDFTNNQIVKLDALNTLRGLTELRLSINHIKKIENLEALTTLTRLILDNNQISEIENLVYLENLIELDLSFNQISEIKNLDALTGLTVLNLSYNQISEIKNLETLSELAKLDLSENQISEIKNLDQLTSLKLLEINDNRISEIRNLDQLTALRLLDLSSNQISEIKNLGRLTALTDLYLSYTQISEIKNLDGLTALTLLYLSSNQIREIKNLDQLSALVALHLSSNQICEIKNIGHLTNLTLLDLSDNQISEIKNLDQLTKLTELDLSNNRIVSLSGLSINLLEKIDIVDLSNNLIKGTTITDWKNPKAILGYLESQQDEQVTNYHLKVNIIGEGRIGKTQLLKYWKEGGVYQANEPETHGTLTTQFKIPGSEYRATIWDFGGQSYHHGFHHVFLRPNDFNLVLWRNVLTKEPDYGYWLGTARLFSVPKQNEYITAPLLLVQNVWSEMDFPDQESTYLPDWVAFPDSQKMQKYRVPFGDVFVIDVKNLHKKDEIWKARHDYFEGSLYQKMIFHTRIMLPSISKKWLTIKEELDHNPIQEITLKKEDFRKQYAYNFDEAALMGLLDYLEFTGNIIKFPEPSSLSDYVFPDPPKLSKWIYDDVLNKKFKNANEGIIEYTKLKKLVGAEKAEIFREIMDEFNLLFTEKENKNNLVIPQFLPENNNSFKRLILQLIPYSFCLRFADFFHESRIFQFISEYGEYADDKTSYWRYGLVFTKEKINALVYYHQEKRIVFVHLENKRGRIKLAQEIFDYFTSIKVDLIKSEEILHQIKNSLRERYINEIIENRKKSGIKGPIDPHFSDEKVHRELAGREQEFRNRKREKPNPDDLIEGARLSVNQKDYIDIKDTLRSKADIPVGICVESRQPIKLDNLTLNLLGMVNQKLPKVFISYSRKDLQFKDELKNYLSSLEAYDLLTAWSCEEIQAGTWDSQIQNQLEEADIIVYMVSQNFMASGYIMEQEVAKGIKMAQENPNKKIICVLVRNCLWKRWSFMEEKFKDVLDKDGKEVFSKDLSKYQFLPYHQYKNQEGVSIREEIVALEEWGRYPYHVSSVAYTQVAERILAEVTR